MADESVAVVRFRRSLIAFRSILRFWKIQYSPVYVQAILSKWVMIWMEQTSSYPVAGPHGMPRS